jgi:hypothetical protein
VALPIILATQEAETWRIQFITSPVQIIQESLSQKNSTQKKAGRVAQGVGLEYGGWGRREIPNTK